MKKTKIVATLAVAFMLGAIVPIMELSTSANVSAADQEASMLLDDSPRSIEQVTDQIVEIATPRADDANPELSFSGKVEVNNSADLIKAMTTDEVTEVILTTDITFSEAESKSGGIVLRRPSDLAPITLNLNGHNLHANGPYAIHVMTGHMIVTGEGMISVTPVINPNTQLSNSIAVVVKGSVNATDQNYSSLVFGKKVTVSAPDSYGVMVDKKSQPSAYGCKLEVNGKINAMQTLYMNGSIQHTENPVQITVGDTAELNADKFAIYAAGYAKWNIGTATIVGETAVGVKAGELNFNNTNIRAFGEPGTPTAQTGGMDDNGTVFGVEYNENYAGKMVLNINGGRYESEKSDVFRIYGKNKANDENVAARAELEKADININGGEFIAPAGRQIFAGEAEPGEIEVNGGKFTVGGAAAEDISQYLASNLTIDNNGNVVTVDVSNRPNHSQSGSTSAPDAPEGPSDVDAPTDQGANSDAAPGTGINQGKGALSAVSTIVPMAIGAGVMILLACGYKVCTHRRAMRAIEVEIEIEEQVAEIIDEPEELVIERFAAEPIVREQPKIVSVDSFIFQK